MSGRSPEELSIASTLMSGSFGFIGLAIFASASVFDKVEPEALKLGFWVGLAAVTCFIASILFGGWGISRPLRRGFLNAFNLQVLTGLAGIALLCTAGGISILNPVTEVPSTPKIHEIKEVGDLKAMVIEQKQKIERLEDVVLRRPLVVNAPGGAPDRITVNYRKATPRSKTVVNARGSDRCLRDTSNSEDLSKNNVPTH